MRLQPDKNIFLDGLGGKIKGAVSFDLPLAQFVIKHKKNSTLFFRHKRTKNFLTLDSKLYLTDQELKKIRRGEAVFRPCGRIASVNHRIIALQKEYAVRMKFDMYSSIKDRYSSWENYARDLINGTVRGVSVPKMWNVSIVASVIFGMFLMTMVYRYLGQGALAKNKDSKTSGKVLGESAERDGSEEEINPQYITQLLNDYEAKKKEAEQAGIEDREILEQEIRLMTKGYPIEKMAPEIAKKDRVVAAFIVAIAKKESNWGKRVPVLDGKDCLNYWGFRAKRKKMGTGGHTCFDSNQDAVDSVAKRLAFLVENEKVNTPGKMVTVWKCGYDCSWDNPKAVQKWVTDVDMYFKKFNKAS